MNLKKIISVIAAAAVSVSALAFSASAAWTDTNMADQNALGIAVAGVPVEDYGKADVEVMTLPDGMTLADIAQVRIDFTATAGEVNLIFGYESNGWWGQNALKIEDNREGYIYNVPADLKDFEYFKIIVRDNWNGIVSEATVTILDASGAEIALSAYAPPAEEAPADDTAETEETTVVAETLPATIDETEFVEDEEIIVEDEEIIVEEEIVEEEIVEEEAVEVVEAEQTAIPKTGNTAAAVISVMAIAGMTVLVSRKRK